jgi:hypothetical protein
MSKPQHNRKKANKQSTSSDAHVVYRLHSLGKLWTKRESLPYVNSFMCFAFKRIVWQKITVKKLDVTKP